MTFGVYDKELKNLEDNAIMMTRSLAQANNVRDVKIYEYVTDFKNRLITAINLSFNDVYGREPSFSDFLAKVFEFVKSSVPMAYIGGEGWDFNFKKPYITGNPDTEWYLGGNIQLSFLSPISEWVTKPLFFSDQATALALNTDNIIKNSLTDPIRIYGNSALDDLTSVSLRKAFPTYSNTYIDLAIKHLIYDYGAGFSVYDAYTYGKNLYSSIVNDTIWILNYQLKLSDIEKQAASRGAKLLSKGMGGAFHGPEADEFFRKQDFNQTLFQAGLFKNNKKYLVVGDEPQGAMSFDIAQVLSPESAESFKKLSLILPRSMLLEWFEKNLSPSISFAQRDMIWGAIINLFNETNLNYIKSHPGLTIESWESNKITNMVENSTNEAVKSIQDRFNQYEQNSNLPVKAQKLLLAYAELPRLGDLGLEISRQSAVNELIKKKQYDMVQAIIDAYRYAHQTEIGKALKEPIPFDIQDQSGRVVKASS